MTTPVFSEVDRKLSTGPLRLRVAGTGRALIHLHSSAGPRISKVVEALADHHTVHALFMPGFEGMPRHADVKTIQDLANLVGEYIRSECGGACDIVGESFGAWIGMWVAVLHPDLVGQLVLEGPAGLRPPSKGGLPEDPRERIKALHASPDRMPQETRSEQVLLGNRKAATAYIASVSFDEALASRLGEIRARTLVLMGTFDKVIPAETGQLIKARVPSSHLTYIWDAAHALEFDQPKRVATLMLDFLDRGESFLVKQAAPAA
jgi:pimeloyl-ACP methyl ester carboxylesterase